MRNKKQSKMISEPLPVYRNHASWSEMDNQSVIEMSNNRNDDTDTIYQNSVNNNANKKRRCQILSESRLFSIYFFITIIPYIYGITLFWKCQTSSLYFIFAITFFYTIVFTLWFILSIFKAVKMFKLEKFDIDRSFIVTTIISTFVLVVLLSVSISSNTDDCNKLCLISYLVTSVVSFLLSSLYIICFNK